MNNDKRSKHVDAAVEAANKVNIVLKKYPKFTVGDDVSQTEFEQAIKDLSDSHGQFLDKDAERTGAKNDRSAKLHTLRSLITRARSGFRNKFGPDSTEYQLSGCTRASDRRKPRRAKRNATANGNGNGNANGNGRVNEPATSDVLPIVQR